MSPTDVIQCDGHHLAGAEAICGEDGISPELKKRMQGKSCFNFKDVDEKLFKELAALTEISYKRLKEVTFFG